MLNIDEIRKLNDLDSVKELIKVKEEVTKLNLPKSEFLNIGNNMFTISSESHLNSLSPVIREELGLGLSCMTNHDAQLQLRYKDLKNKYIALGKSCASINFLFDLIEEIISPLDIVLMHELLMDDGEYRTNDVSLKHLDGTILTITSENIFQNVEKLLSWYHDVSNENNEEFSIVIASLFHYFLLSIHPFNDGNGRLSRIFLNLILLKNNLFPIIIPNIQRKNYYESLVSADNGSFEELVNLIATLSTTKFNEYLKLTKDLSLINDNIECLVLTEDGNTGMIESLLDFHGINLETTIIESYEGKDNIASAVFLAKKFKEKNTNIKHIIFHRDRDNEIVQNLKSNLKKLVKNNGLEDISTIFITKYYDMESYFINDKHVSEIFPQLSIFNSKMLIELALENTSEKSKKKLRLALSSQRKYNIEDPMEQADKINKLYDDNPIKYMYGKAVLWELEELITKEIGMTTKITLVQKSTNIEIPEFKKLYSILNGK